MTPITFRVDGKPIPQPRPKVTTRGPFARAYTPAGHPIHSYRAAVAAAAKAAGAVPTGDAPLILKVDFVFPRPKSHLRKRGLKPDAPRLPRCDVSNCLKGLEDALIGVAYHDDSQVGMIVATKKWGAQGSTTVTIAAGMSDGGQPQEK